MPTMIPQVVEARHVKDYRVWLKFQDGTEGEVDLKDELWGEVFEPLRDTTVFRGLKVSGVGPFILYNLAFGRRIFCWRPRFLFSDVEELRRNPHDRRCGRTLVAHRKLL